jgi:hypothetical protein
VFPKAIITVSGMFLYPQAACLDLQSEMVTVLQLPTRTYNLTSHSSDTFLQENLFVEALVV